VKHGNLMMQLVDVKLVLILIQADQVQVDQVQADLVQQEVKEEQLQLDIGIAQVDHAGVDMEILKIPLIALQMLCTKLHPITSTVLNIMELLLYLPL